MATTNRSVAEVPKRVRAGRHVAALLACLGASSAFAQQWGMDLGLASQLTWTSNSSFGVAAGGQEDTVLELRPHLRLHGEGARLRLSGTASVAGIAYANGTQPNLLEPTADLSARLEAIERLFFLEAGYRAAQTSQNPFGARPDSAFTANTLTASQWRFSPVIEGAAGSGLRYRLRSDNTWTREIGASDLAVAPDAGGGYFGRHAASIERDPQPFGWHLEAERALTRYNDPAQTSVSIETARLILSYALGEDWSAGLRAGYERNNIESVEQRRRSIYGVEARWRPSPRTTLSAFHEQRFFGSGWNLAFDHRRPQLALSMLFSRGIDTTPQAFLDLPATDNVAGLLDAAFTTRYPDPIERARVVQDYISRQGLPSATFGPLSLFAPRFSLVTERRASVTLLGSRNSLTLSGFSTRTEDAIDLGPLATGAAATNNVQYGASVVLSHRLNPLTGLSVTLDWSRIRALDMLVPDESTQRGVRVQTSLRVAPLTSTFFGGRYRKIESNVAIQGREGAVFAGLDHRF